MAEMENVPSAFQSTAVKNQQTAAQLSFQTASPGVGEFSPRRNLSADLLAESPVLEIKSSSITMSAAQSQDVSTTETAHSVNQPQKPLAKPSIFGTIPTASITSQAEATTAANSRFVFGQPGQFNFNRPFSSRPREGLFKTLPPLLRPQVKHLTGACGRDHMR
jgi:hypothetical protein